MENNVVFKPVSSSQIKEIGYDEPSKTLYVRFKSKNKVYSYAPVSEGTYNELMASKSIGKFFYAEIRLKVKAKLE
jgi:hypothetical protein